MAKIVSNGVSARSLGSVRWRRARVSNAYGNCVELAALDTGQVAVRNSRDPHGPVLICSREQIAAVVAGVKAAQWDPMQWDPTQWDQTRSDGVL